MHRETFYKKYYGKINPDTQINILKTLYKDFTNLTSCPKCTFDMSLTYLPTRESNL